MEAGLAEAADSAIVTAANLLTALSAMATLQEQTVALQRQIDHLHGEIALSGITSEKLTDAKFVTFRTLIDSNETQVKLALDATTKAIDKAEQATAKAIEKAEAANNDRFASVNEFRAQLSDLIRRFATQERVDLLYNQTQQRLDEINSNIMARIADQSERINEHSIRLTKIEEFARGAQGNTNKIYAAIGAAVGLIAIIVFIANVLTRNG